MADELFLQTPIGGIPYQDWTIVNYVDLAPDSSVEDFRGGNYSYDGHNAIDFTLPHFEAMDDGIPVYASLPGTVTQVTDIHPDRCSTENPCSTPANLIAIDHGDGLTTRYLHLRTDSATVAVGDSVEAGQEIALVGSSGNSTDAHLHFEVIKDGEIIEVNTPGDEFSWQSPIAYADDVVGSLDHDITDHSPSFAELLERPDTVDSFTQQSGHTPHIWTHLHGIDQGDDLDFYFREPDGTLHTHLHWSAPQIRYGWWNAGISLPDDPDLGTWEVEFQHNGSTMLTDTFPVVPESSTANITVDTLVDENDGDYSAGDLSLREAIAIADAGDTVTFDSSLSDGTIDLSLGELVIDQDLTIQGLGADNLAISGNNSSRVFLIDDSNSASQSNVSIDGLTVADGGLSLQTDGGGIFNQENLTVTNSALISNGGRYGLAIYNTGQLQLDNSLVTGNSGAVSPIYNDGGVASISNTTVANNSTAGSNSAIGNVAGGELRLSNSTIVDNDGSDAAVANSDDSTAIITSSIIADNIGFRHFQGINNVSGAFISNGNNLIGDGDGSTGFDHPSDLVGTLENPIDPKLGELQNNGGATSTIALLNDSPAIDAGSNPNGLPFDQRGDGFNRSMGNGTDIGAFELQTIPDITEIVGTTGGDLLFGTEGRDRLVGLDGKDTIDGLGGDDTILGDGGNDSLSGSFGDDFLEGADGFDTLFGGDGNDTLQGGVGNDSLNGSTGLDAIFGGDGRDTLIGDADNDTLAGGMGSDSLEGGVGADLLTGDEGRDTLLGGSDNDTLRGGAGVDFLGGDDGDDFLFGQEDNDSLLGGSGNDLLDGGLGRDYLRGDDGDDTFVLTSGAGTDLIVDFGRGNNLLGLSSGISFADLSFSGNRIVFGDETLATFNGFDTTTLTESDFVDV